MKHVLSLTLSFLFFAIIANFSLAFSNANREQVVDINGNPIFPGGTYYILPAIRGPAGGGLRLGKTGGSSCALTILQDYNEIENGLPVKFSIPGISPGIIFTGTQLNIKFLIKPKCAKSSNWLIFDDEVLQKACIGIGTPENYTGMKTYSGTFNIQKSASGFGYKLVFCIKDSSTCFDIGNQNDNGEGGKRLNLTHQEAFEVVFVNTANSYEAETIKSVVEI